VTLIDRATADLRLIAEYWPGLAELRDPSVYAPRPASLLTPEQRAENDHAARIERQERDGLMPGEHQDAARADVLDLMASLAADAEMMADVVAQYLEDDGPEALSSAFADPTHVLHFVTARLGRLDRDTAYWVSYQAHRMLADVSRALCLTFDGQLLQVVCLWCGGGPTGARTWRVRQLPGDEIAIVCEGDQPCEPPSKSVGTWWKQRPCWPMREWEWLAKQLLAADARGVA
jgi:hypothetical protein